MSRLLVRSQRIFSFFSLVFVFFFITCVLHSHVAFATTPTTDPARSFSPLREIRTSELYIQPNSFTGAYEHSYPFVLPKGRNAVAPALSVNYSSQLSNFDSIVGYGWTLSIPYIERINKTGTNKLYATSTKNFLSSLSGELKPMSTSGFVGTYGAEVEEGDFISYEYLSDNSWKAISKDGTTYIFGTTTASRQDDPDDATRVYKWMLSKVTDTNGNSITYYYTKDNAQIYPYKIRYTGDASSEGIYEVLFTYEGRASIVQSKPAFEVRTNSRINTVDVKVSGTLVHRYDFSYATSTESGFSLLSSIQESGHDGGSSTTLPSMQFSYATSSMAWQLDNNWSDLPIIFSGTDSVGGNNLEGIDKGVRLLDVTGDGISDLVKIGAGIGENTGTTSESAGDGTRGAYFTNPVTKTWPSTADSDANEVPNIVDRYGDNGDWLSGDFDADGFADFYDYVGRDFYWNNGDGTFTASSTSPNTPDLDGSTQGFNDDLQGVRVGDVNGDGLPDLIRNTANPANGTTGDLLNTKNGVYLNNGNRQGWVKTPWYIPIVFYGAHCTSGCSGVDTGGYFIDMNADGLDDIVGGSATTTTPGVLQQSTNIYYNNGGGSWTMGGSIGDTTVSLYNLSGTTYPYDTGVRFVDMNGDFVPDTVTGVESAGGNSTDPGSSASTKLLTSTQSGITNTFPRSIIKNMCDNCFWSRDQGVRFGDINGDGMMDILRAYQDKAPEVYIHTGRRPNLLNGITLSTGGTLSIEYSHTSEQLNTAQNAIINPDLPIAFPVVSKVTANAGFGTQEVTEFTYGGGMYKVYDSFDRRFVGFATTTQEDSLGNTTTTFRHQGNSTNSTKGEYADSKSKIGKVYRTEVRDSAGDLYALSIQKWDHYDLGSGRNFVKKIQDVSLTYDGDVDHKDTAVTYTYDDTNGNMTQKVEWGLVSASSNGTFSDIGTDKRTTNITYASNEASLVRNAPASVTIQDQSANKRKETKLYYDNQSYGSVTNGNKTKESAWKSGSIYLDTLTTYNSRGLVTTQTDPRGKTTTYNYDPHYLFVATTTSPLNHSDQYYYDYSSGKPTKHIDKNGVVFETVYDGLDRVVLEKIPDHLGTPSTLVNKSAYTYTDTAGAKSIERLNYFGTATSSQHITYFDGMNRVIQERHETEGTNTYRVTDTSYDTRGNVYAKSLPYTASSSARSAITTNQDLLVTYAYDPLNRVLTETNATGIEVHEYDQNIESVTDRSLNLKHYVRDAYGNLSLVQEKIGASTYTTSYTYDVLGNLTKLTDALSNIRHFSYDGLSRQLLAEDLHASADSTFASTTYAYDDAGNLVSKTDGKLQTVVYTYDNGNRILTENYTGEAGTEIAYSYDWCAYGIGRLCSATSTNAVTTYSYDALGNTTHEKVTIDGTLYDTAKVFDRQGSITTLTHPNGYAISYRLDSAGELESVAGKNASDAEYSYIVKKTNYGPSGKIGMRQFANNAETAYTYDASELYRLRSLVTTASTTAEANPTSAHALLLDAANSEYVLIADANQTGLDLSGDQTYEGWFRLDSLPTTGNAFGLFSKSDPSSNNQGIAIQYYNDGGTLKFRIRTSANGSSYSQGTVSYALGTDLWHHLAFAYTASTGSVAVYVDGKNIGTVSGLNTSIYNNTAPFEIGAGVNAGGGYYNGTIDEARVWSDVRTVSEIVANAGTDISAQANLVGYWQFNDVYTDASGNANTLVPQNAPGFVTELPYHSPASVAESSDLTNGLISYWELEETSGTRADSHSTNDLTDVNAVASATGIQGTAADFERSSDNRLSISDASQTGLDLTGDISISLWVKPESQPNAQYWFLTKNNSGTANKGYGLGYDSEGGDKIRFITSSNGTNIASLNISQNITTGAWHHVATSYDASAGVGHFYLDGALVGFLSGGYSTIYDSSAAFILGALGNPTSHYDGLMDEVAIYNRTLEYGEILDLYNEGSAIPYSAGEMMMMRIAGGGADVSGKQKVQKNKDWVDGNSIESPDYYLFTATSTPETKKVLEKYLKHLKDTNNNDKNNDKNKDNTQSDTTTQDTKDVVEEGSNEESIKPSDEVREEVTNGEGSNLQEEVVEEVLEEGSPQSPELLEDVAEENTKPPEKALEDVLKENNKKPLKKIDEEVGFATSTLNFFPSLEMWALNTHSLLLDGNNDYTYITDAGQTGLDLSGDLTIEFWVKPTSLPGDAFIVSKDDISLGKQAYWVALDSSGKVFGRFSDNGSDDGGHRVNFTTNNVISTGSWQHVAAVYDISEDTALVYVNGSPVTTTNTSSMGSSIYNSDVHFVHGARTFENEMTSFYNGLIDDVRVWNDIRTQAEINEYKDIELVGDEANLVSYWKYDNNTNDETINDNGLATSGGVSYSTDVAFVESVNGTSTPPTMLYAEGQTNPTNLHDLTPEFSALFHDPDNEDTALYYQIQVIASGGSWNTPHWDSTKIALPVPVTEGARSPSISYEGDSLSPATTYNWRIKFWDNLDKEGAYSTTTASFSIAPRTTVGTTTPVQIGGIQNLSYEYDNVGNITKLINNANTTAAATTTYTYDALYRLLTASTTQATSTPYTHTYTYNALGNLLTDTSNGTYTYAGTGHTNPHAPTNIQGTTLAYDNNGNLITKGTITYAWDYRDRLITSTASSSTTTFSYNHHTRIQKGTGTATTTYPTPLYTVTPATTTISVYDLSGTLLATIQSDGIATTTYSHLDHLGSLSAVTNTDGDLIQTLDYYPYGATRIDEGTDVSQREYIGEHYDEESNLSYLNARYYEGSRGQFLSQDPSFLDIGSAGFENKYERTLQQHLMNPQALNAYSYGLNNPIINKDPEGEIVPLLIGAYIAAEFALSAYDAYSTAATLADPSASGGEKAFSAGGFVAGLALPGAGYGTAANKAAQLAKNAEQGKAFENVVGKLFGKDNVITAKQVTIQAKDGTKTRVDFIGRDACGNCTILEAKSSQTAPLTKNQQSAFPQIGKSGGTVVGAGKPGFPGGTQISPTNVKIIRPK